MDKEYIKADQVKAMTSIPVARPTFLSRYGDISRVIGFVVCCGKAFDYNGDEFATFPIDEDGIIWTSIDGNNGMAGIFHGPIVRGSSKYVDLYNAYKESRGTSADAIFDTYCRSVGLEIIG